MNIGRGQIIGALFNFTAASEKSPFLNLSDAAHPQFLKQPLVTQGID